MARDGDERACDERRSGRRPSLDVEVDGLAADGTFAFRLRHEVGGLGRSAARRC